MPSRMLDENPYSFPNFNGYTNEIGELTSNCIPHFKLGVITYPYRDSSYTMLIKEATDVSTVRFDYWTDWSPTTGNTYLRSTHNGRHVSDDLFTYICLWWITLVITALSVTMTLRMYDLTFWILDRLETCGEVGHLGYSLVNYAWFAHTLAPRGIDRLQIHHSITANNLQLTTKPTYILYISHLNTKKWNSVWYFLCWQQFEVNDGSIFIQN